MALSREEMNNSIQAIGKCEDEATRLSLLATLTANIGEVYDDNDSLTEQNSTLTDNNSKLKEANMNLFLQIGSKGTENQNNKSSENNTSEDSLKYEDLFNENGGLK